MKAEEFDRKFDDSEDLIEYLDLSTWKRLELEREQLSVSFPKWMIKELDKEAKRLGIERQSLIKFWISERLDSISAR